MVTKKKGLGRGLDALLSKASEPETIQEGDVLKTLPVDLLQRGQYQPRIEMDESALGELAASIKAQGLIQPILIRPLGKQNSYEIIAGERRWRAAQMAGLDEVPVVIRKVPDQTAMCMALIENIQREDLNPLEEAQALHRLLEEFDMTHEEVADAVGRSRSSVSNLLRLLELDNKVKLQVMERKLDMGHARALLAIPRAQQYELAAEVIKKELSVRATEALVKSRQGKKTSQKGAAASKDVNIIRLEHDLAEKLGSPVNIKHQSSGKGSLTIQYHSLDELDGILNKIQ